MWGILYKEEYHFLMKKENQGKDLAKEVFFNIVSDGG
jgi:hypothetical protein